MANRTLYPSTSFGAGRVYMEFELLGAGAATLTVGTDGAQAVAGVARSGTGTFVVTLKDAWPKDVFKSVDVDDSLADGSYGTVGNVMNEGTTTPLTFTIYIRSAAGALADPAVGRRIGVSLSLRNTANNNWGQK